MSSIRSLRKREWGKKFKTVLQELAEDKAATCRLEEMQCGLPTSVRSTFLFEFSPDGKKVASTHADHNIWVCEVRTGKLLHTLRGHPRTPWCLAFHPTSNDILASGCLGGEVRVWDLHGGSEVWVVDQKPVITSLAFHPVDKVLVVATLNQLHFWDWSLPAPFATCETASEKEKVRFVKFDEHGNHLITGITNVPQESHRSHVWESVFGPTFTRTSPSRTFISQRRSILSRLMSMYRHLEGLEGTPRYPGTSSSGEPMSPTQDDALQRARMFAEEVSIQNAQLHRQRLFNLDQALGIRANGSDILDNDLAGEEPAREEASVAAEEEDEEEVESQQPQSEVGGSRDSAPLTGVPSEALAANADFWVTFHRLRFICSSLERRMQQQPPASLVIDLPPPPPTNFPTQLAPSSSSSSLDDLNRGDGLNLGSEGSGNPPDVSMSLVALLTRLQHSLQSLSNAALTTAVAREQIQQVRTRIAEILESLANVSGYRARLTSLRDQIYEAADGMVLRGEDNTPTQRWDLAYCLWLVEMSLQLTRQMQRILAADYRLTQLHLTSAMPSSGPSAAASSAASTSVNSPSLLDNLPSVNRSTSVSRSSAETSPSLLESLRHLPPVSSSSLFPNLSSATATVPSTATLLANLSSASTSLSLANSTLIANLRSVSSQINANASTVNTNASTVNTNTSTENPNPASRIISSLQHAFLTSSSALLDSLPSTSSILNPAPATSTSSSTNATNSSSNTNTSSIWRNQQTSSLHTLAALAAQRSNQSNLTGITPLSSSSSASSASSFDPLAAFYFGQGLSQGIERTVRSHVSNNEQSSTSTDSNSAGSTRPCAIHRRGNRVNIFSGLPRRRLPNPLSSSQSWHSSDTSPFLWRDPQRAEERLVDPATATRIRNLGFSTLGDLPPFPSFSSLFNEETSNSSGNNQANGVSPGVADASTSTPSASFQSVEGMAGTSGRNTDGRPPLSSRASTRVVTSANRVLRSSVARRRLSPFVMRRRMFRSGAGRVPGDNPPSMRDEASAPEPRRAPRRIRSSPWDRIGDMPHHRPFVIPSVQVEPSPESPPPLPAHQRPRSPPLSAILSGAGVDLLVGGSGVIDPVASGNNFPRPGNPVSYFSLLYDSNFRRRARMGMESTHNITHRIQCWDFADCAIPNIYDADKSVVVQKCKINNDASVDISRDGQLLAALVPNTGSLVPVVMLAVYSLRPRNMGQCLYTWSFENSNAISVSFSPLARYLVVGMSSSRNTLGPPEREPVAQIFRLDPQTKSSSLTYVSSVYQEGSGSQQLHSLNCVRWLPQSGQGLIYGTNRGLLLICRPVSSSSRVTDGQRTCSLQLVSTATQTQASHPVMQTTGTQTQEES